jgi:hypothetical protein
MTWFNNDSTTMKRRTNKQPNDYPRISLRINAELLGRVDSVRTNSALSYGQIVTMALRKCLPEIEKFHAPNKAAQ